MSRKKYVPSKRDLNKAWTVKKQGGKKKDICKRLNITIKQYEAHTQTFNGYFKRERLKQKLTDYTGGKTSSVYKNKPPNMKNRETKLEIGNIDIDNLKAYIMLGYSREKIASMLGVSRVTLFNFIKTNPEIEYIFEHAVEDTLTDVYRNGLLLLCKKHELPDTHFASYQGEITSKPTKKHFNPDVTALKYMFANKLGWATEPQPERTNNKGAILKMLDDICNGEEDQDHTPTKKKE